MKHAHANFAKYLVIWTLFPEKLLFYLFPAFLSFFLVSLKDNQPKDFKKWYTPKDVDSVF